MTKEDLLSNLKDIHLPPEVSVWPFALGWWILVFLFVLIVIILSHIFWRRYRQERPKIESLRIFEEIKNQYDNKNDLVITLVNLSQLMRRVAITFYAKEDVASLHGLSWLEFLDKTGKTNEFTKGLGKIFGFEIYMKHPSTDIDAIFHLVKRWMDESTHQKI